MSRATCNDCLHHDIGVCRRYPPTAAGFPTVASDDWCSEQSIIPVPAPAPEVSIDIPV